jgi:acyl-CoA thioester hydrolase
MVDRMKTFKTQLRVRYAETDAAEVVYYGSFFLYFEVGKIEMYREIGLPYQWDIPIVDTYCKYLAPVYFDDVLEVHTKFSDIKKKSFKIESKVYKKSDDGELQLVADGYTTHVFIDEDRKAINLPDHYLRIFKKLENEE